ncbi:MAG: hypothetical protein ACP5UA_04670 [Candidatus Hydrogenedens sp.]
MLVYCSLIVLLAFVIRIYNISDESVWWDEYSSLVHINAESLKEFLFLNPLYDPATMPVYYILEYLFWHYVSPSVIGLRLLSILLSVMTIPVLFLIGRRFNSEKMGLLAGFFFAISPIHRFFGQGIRMYVLLTLLFTLSIYFLLLYSENRNRKNWITLTLINILLLWTHPFAVIILIIEIVWIFYVFYTSDYKKYYFIASQILISIPSIVYISSIHYYSSEQSSWFKIPTLFEFLGDLFADDAVKMTYQVRVIEEVIPKYFINIHSIFDASLLVITTIVMILSFRFVFRHVDNESELKLRYGIVLLLLIILIPPLLLYVLSIIWRPCIFPRYTLYCSLAIYLLYGSLIKINKHKIIGYLLLIFLILILCYQLIITLPGPQRTNWQDTVHFIEKQNSDKENSPVFVYQAINKDVFTFNLKNEKIPVSFVEDISTFIPIIHELFQRKSSCLSDKIWFVYISFYFGDFGSPELECLLSNNQIQYETYDLYGIEPIRLYKVLFQQGGGYSHQAGKEFENDSLKFTISDFALANVETNHKECAMYLIEKLINNDPLQKLQFQNLYNTLKSGGNITTLTKSLRYYQISQRNINPGYKEYFLQKAILLDKDLKLAYLCFDAIMTSINGDMKTTQEKLRFIIHINPDIALPRIALGVISLSQGNEEEAKNWFYSAIQCENGQYRSWKNLLDSIFIEKNYKKALREYYELKDKGIFIESFFEEYLTAKLGSEGR